MIKRENVRVCIPRYLQIGKGSLNELPEIIKILGSIKSLLIVTDKQMVAFGYVKRLQEVLSKAGLKSDVFDDTVPDPTDTVVLKGIQFLEKCKNVGVDGLIIVDLPWPENKKFSARCKKKAITFIQLLSPTTSATRMRQILKDSHDMVYYISMLSTTGGKLKVSPKVILKNYSKIK